MSLKNLLPEYLSPSAIIGGVCLWGCLGGFFYFGTPAQFMLDREVNRLCAKDGGARVYETVELPRESFDEHGRLRPQPIPSSITASFGPVPGYEFLRVKKELKTGSPRLVMSRAQILRSRDSKVLGEYVRYIRVGGGVLGESLQGNSYSCPSQNALPGELSNLIFKSQSPK